MEIPLINLKRQYLEIKEEINNSIQEVINESSFCVGRQIKEFENNFANYLNIKHAIGVANGTAALHLALEAIDIKENDEIITTSNTFIATVEAICYQKAKPILVDIDEETYTIDINKIEEKITNKTKAIIPVHLFGHPCEMDAIKKIANKYNLKIIEDCAQAHGVEYKGQKVGTIGDIGCFSMYPSKILGAYGDAGAIITNNYLFAEKIKKLKNHGESTKYNHELMGYNYRLDGIQAAILNVKLKYLNKWLEKRREIARIYNEEIKELVTIPSEKAFAKHGYYLYVIRAKERNNLLEFLKIKGISCGIHYPIPIHLQLAYQSLNMGETKLPITERISKEILSVPLYPEMTNEEIDYVINSIKEYFNKK
ncbi:MAG TPA: DegT/DnrJ/EryC1/StrS family aminotransferase [Candidatus Nanoarchaeia archaeon]|nr:DegT/DnrJ/EryC1/StrS family aminotransferase [Candidatus Nanoarchaeia archaeon]